MPSYQVIKKCFFGGKLYDPEGKRKVLHTDVPLKPVPRALRAIVDKPETAAERKARLKQEADAKKADEAKQKEDKKAIDAVTFNEAPSLSGPVETL